MFSPASVLGLLLLISAATNWLLWSSRDAALEEAQQFQTERDNALAAGSKCSAAVKQLQEDNEAQIRNNLAELNKAAEAARAAEARANKILSARPSNPNDLCASALELSRRRLKELGR